MIREWLLKGLEKDLTKKIEKLEGEILILKREVNGGDWGIFDYFPRPGLVDKVAALAGGREFTRVPGKPAYYKLKEEKTK